MKKRIGFENKLSIIKGQIISLIEECPSSNFVNDLSDCLKIINKLLWFTKIRKKNNWDGYN